MQIRERNPQISFLAKGFVLVSGSIVWAYSVLDHIGTLMS